MDDLFDLSEFKEQAKEIDESYKETYAKLESEVKDFSATKCIAIMAKFKTEQLKLLIGENISEYDEKILNGVVERHIASVVYKG